MDTKNRSIAVLGTGALGGLYGGLLAKAGQQVHFLVRSDFEHVRLHGLQVDSPLGNFHVAAPNVYTRAEDMPQVDLVMVCWKTTSNAQLADALARICRPDTIVLVLQNGLDVERDAALAVGTENVLGGCCFLCSNKIGPGHIQHLDFGRIAFGEYASQHSGSITSRMTDIANQFQSAGIDMQPAEDLRAVRWRKLAWNIPFNGLSVVLNSDTRAIMHDPHGRKLAEALMRELQEAAAAVGVVVPDQHLERLLADTAKMVPYDSSMLIDYRAKRELEIEAILESPVRASIDSGYEPRKIAMLSEQLRFLDRRNRNVLSADSE